MLIAPRSLVRSFALLFALALFGAACAPKTPAAPPVSADAWAVVNGHEIKRDQVEKAYRRTAQTNAGSEEELLTAKLTLLNDLVVQEILISKAAALKVVLSDSELDAAFAEGQKNITPEAFQAELKQRDLTSADMKDGLRRDLLAQKVMEQEVVAKVNVTDQEVTDFFNANKAQFNRPEEAYHIAQIVVTPAREQVNNRTGDDATTPQEATAKTQMIMERLKAGASFADVAADFSEDTQTAPRGGDLGFVPVSALQQAAPALRDAVLKSKPGSATVVSLNGGHTVVLVVAHDTAGQKDLSMPEVKTAITTGLKGRKETLLRAAYLNSIRNDAVVVNVLAQKLVESKGKLPAAAAPAAK